MPGRPTKRPGILLKNYSHFFGKEFATYKKKTYICGRKAKAHEKYEIIIPY